MTEAAFFTTDGFHDIRIRGHAGFGEPDIVCSAASMLACTLIEALRGREGFRFLVKSGNVRVSARRGREADIIVDTVKKGYAMLAGKYPENVKITTQAGQHGPEEMGEKINEQNH